MEMYIATGLLILSFGSMLRLISCYSDGSFLEEDQCQAMNIIHLDRSGAQISAQNTEARFKVEPENVTVSEGNTGRITAKCFFQMCHFKLSHFTTVTLSGGSSKFEGFMLDSRQCDNCPSVGTFSLDDLDNSQLICGGSVVVHINNLKKNSITVFWTPTAAGLFFFRAAVVEDFFTFWRRKRIDVPSTTPPPSETSAHTRLTTSPTESHATALLTGTSTAPPISGANSTQTNLTTSTTKFTTSNIDSQAPALLTGTSAAPTIPEAKSIQTNPTTSKTIFASILIEVKAFFAGNCASPSISEAISSQINITSGTSIFVSISNVLQAPVCCSCRNLWDPLSTLYAVLMFWSHIFLL
ncbi:uncharacterized protein LOC130086109 [Rhinichthys klamathensis goyatoka]|uniref:uncharacterized protein LOC130086109 n=1 Tax=Rhinichthys klamathensis goyatoka TaxID=3034132 RepID=UPI0024B48F6C|nr:uncharacterized protein LOC130086109 [Rhinichthys klamathensis goyatoka]